MGDDPVGDDGAVGDDPVGDDGAVGVGTLGVGAGTVGAAAGATGDGTGTVGLLGPPVLVHGHVLLTVAKALTI